MHTIRETILWPRGWDVFIFLFLYSCSTEDSFNSYSAKDRTLIIYISSDNNLSFIADDLYNDIKTGLTLKNSNLLILIDLESTPTLYHMSSNGFVMVEKFRGMRSVDPKCVKKVLSLARLRFPSLETGLVLWSHGSAWLPSGASNQSFRSFGYSKGYECDIKLLARALESHYDYIIFDACLMGSVEVFSEFADKAEFILGSPSIIPSSGIISVSSIDTLLNNKMNLIERLRTICKLYIETTSNIKKSVSFVSSDGLTSFQEKISNLIKSRRFDKKRLYDLKEKYTVRGPIVLHNLEEVISELFPYDKEQILYSMSSFIQCSRSEVSKKVSLSIFIPNEYNENYIKYYSSLLWNKTTSWIYVFDESG